MRKLLVLIISIILFHQTIIAQSNYAVPEALINGTILIQFNGGSGSGVLLQSNNQIYLLTARHVLMNERRNNNISRYILKSAQIEVICYPRKAEMTAPNKMIIDLTTLENSGNLMFGKTPEDDYFIARIAKVRQEEDSNLGFVEYSSAVNRPGKSSSITSLPIEISSNFQNTEIGTDVIMVGYPKSLGLKEIPQYDFNRPLLRKGITAGKDVKTRNIILDCPSFAGNSGGPVFKAVPNTFPSQYMLIGVVSSFIPFKEDWINTNYGIRNVEIVNSGYSVIIPIDKVLNDIQVISNAGLD